ncbi:uncharacterized protein EI90DRAFT_2628752 [Cantharellus anzutake]|uniref:uncharacterized protein n=1 Tax=Cantharellus anzutake TaxID=1750568 RepID=UPI0019059EC8|nr:uncharacterized protein EI90DRAFT_2628752 [Cantharellus anzutake]KAF8319873.1 hypothetical protein EI90DRAFT_2628752 [Cantharellus anzutake]
MPSEYPTDSAGSERNVFIAKTLINFTAELSPERAMSSSAASSNILIDQTSEPQTDFESNSKRHLTVEIQFGTDDAAPIFPLSASEADEEHGDAPEAELKDSLGYGEVDVYLGELDSGMELAKLAPLRREFTRRGIASAHTSSHMYLDDYRSRLYSVRVFCESVLRSPRAARAKIQKVECCIRPTGVRHRFLIFQILRGDMKEVYLRVDRRGDKAVPTRDPILRDLGGSPVKDTARISARRNDLFDRKDNERGRTRVEAELELSNPVSLRDVARVLHVVAGESQTHKLTWENCWFFSAMVQEMLLRNFGAQYKTGALYKVKRTEKRRRKIRNRVYKGFVFPEINGMAATVMTLAKMVDDPSLLKSMQFTLEVIRIGHDIGNHAFSPLATYDIHSRVKHLLAALYEAIHEHLLGHWGFHGARMFKPGFPSQLRQVVTTWVAKHPSFSHTLDAAEFESLATAIQDNLGSSLQPSPSSEHFEHEWSYFFLKGRDDHNSTSLPLRLRNTLLRMVEMMGECMAVEALPWTWRFQMDAEIPTLIDEFERLISPGLRSMGGRWIALLPQADPKAGKFISLLNKSLPYWTVAMAIMGRLDEACDGLRKVCDWMGQSRSDIHDLYDLVTKSKTTLSKSSLSLLRLRHQSIPPSNQLHVLSALRAVIACNVLDELPWLWRFQNNSDIPMLSTEFERRISPELKLACLHWTTLLSQADRRDSRIQSALFKLHALLPFWIAVMSFMGELDRALVCLNDLCEWMRGPPQHEICTAWSQRTKTSSQRRRYLFSLIITRPFRRLIGPMCYLPSRLWLAAVLLMICPGNGDSKTIPTSRHCVTSLKGAFHPS